MATSQTLWFKAPAKINLLLRVVGKRPDGYHDLETWMQKLDLYDEIGLTLLEKSIITLVTDGPDVPRGESNLAWRAAAAFFKASRRGAGCGVTIELKKRIPAAAGLGGGSSDAGTVLRGLNSLFSDEFSDAQLVTMARSLGADVPFFAVPHSAVLAEGIGDLMEPVPPINDCTFLLVNPGFALSTRWVFENFALTRENEDSILAGFRGAREGFLSLSLMHNDLEAVSCRRYPEIEQLKIELLAAGASAAMMSGSGPTVFGVFPDTNRRVDIPAVAERLRRNTKNTVFVVRACVGAWPSGEGTGF